MLGLSVSALTLLVVLEIMALLSLPHCSYSFSKKVLQSAATFGLVTRAGVQGSEDEYQAALLRRQRARGNYPYGNPRRLEEVGLDFPDLKLMQHLYGMNDGYVPHLIKKFPNFRTHAVYNPASTVGEREAASKKWILWCQENIPDQVHIGSDHLWGFPVKKIVEWVQNMPELTAEFKKKVLGENARKWYKIK